MDQRFKITKHEAAILDRIAEATKMDCWFFIDEDLHVHDIEGDMPDATEADLVIMLEEGLGYGLDEPQSGGLSPEEIKIAEACFKRARLAAEAERIEKLKQDVLAGEKDINELIAIYLEHFEDTDVAHVCDLEETAYELKNSKEPDEVAEGRRLDDLINDHPGTTYFDYCEEKPIGRDWLIRRLGIKFFVVPVVYECRGTVCVVADSARDAYEKVRDNPGDYPLPDADFYVEGSYRVADDEDSAIATIEELSEQWNDVPEAPAAPARRTGLAVKATVTFQRWEGDYARFNGEAEFDARGALDAMDDETVRRVSQGEPYALDAVYKGAVRLGQIHDYDGPFEVELDEDQLSEYLAARGLG